MIIPEYRCQNCNTQITKLQYADHDWKNRKLGEFPLTVSQHVVHHGVCYPPVKPPEQRRKVRIFLSSENSFRVTYLASRNHFRVQYNVTCMNIVLIEWCKVLAVSGHLAEPFPSTDWREPDKLERYDIEADNLCLLRRQEMDRRLHPIISKRLEQLRKQQRGQMYAK